MRPIWHEPGALLRQSRRWGPVSSKQLVKPQMLDRRQTVEVQASTRLAVARIHGHGRATNPLNKPDVLPHVAPNSFLLSYDSSKAGRASCLYPYARGTRCSLRPPPTSALGSMRVPPLRTPEPGPPRVHRQGGQPRTDASRGGSNRPPSHGQPRPRRARRAAVGATSRRGRPRRQRRRSSGSRTRAMPAPALRTCGPSVQTAQTRAVPAAGGEPTHGARKHRLELGSHGRRDPAAGLRAKRMPVSIGGGRALENRSPPSRALPETAVSPKGVDRRRARGQKRGVRGGGDQHGQAEGPTAMGTGHPRHQEGVGGHRARCQKVTHAAGRARLLGRSQQLQPGCARSWQKLANSSPGCAAPEECRCGAPLSAVGLRVAGENAGRRRERGAGGPHDGRDAGLRRRTRVSVWSTAHAAAGGARRALGRAPGSESGFEIDRGPGRLREPAQRRGIRGTSAGAVLAAPAQEARGTRRRDSAGGRRREACRRAPRARRREASLGAKFDARAAHTSTGRRSAEVRHPRPKSRARRPTALNHGGVRRSRHSRPSVGSHRRWADICARQATKSSP